MLDGFIPDVFVPDGSVLDGSVLDGFVLGEAGTVLEEDGEGSTGLGDGAAVG